MRPRRPPWAVHHVGMQKKEEIFFRVFFKPIKYFASWNLFNLPATVVVLRIVIKSLLKSQFPADVAAVGKGAGAIAVLFENFSKSRYCSIQNIHPSVDRKSTRLNSSHSS